MSLEIRHGFSSSVVYRMLNFKSLVCNLNLSPVSHEQVPGLLESFFFFLIELKSSSTLHNRMQSRPSGLESESGEASVKRGIRDD